MSPDEIRQLIKANFPIGPVPSVPEIVLHRAAPDSGFWRIAGVDENFGTPYWAYDWGGGLALARFVLDHPETVRGRRVLDLGAGSGIVAIAAAKSGARHVLAADVDRYAVAAITLNAEANSVAVSPFYGDLTIGAAPQVDIILVGDLFYEKALAEYVLEFLDRCRALNIDVLIGDPYRAFLPYRRLRLVAEYAGEDFGAAQTRNAVFALEGTRTGSSR